MASVLIAGANGDAGAEAARRLVPAGHAVRLDDTSDESASAATPAELDVLVNCRSAPLARW
ncbi:hypothetical protein SAMN05216188_11152 [Lentzea xinjiangensis]|uniref:Uncharacterized protein n=1 Tax=Lentzea xinjiangensis TaxID=402600 RepID=A0A1H9NYN4_9PSEU|nr:hypothetical protein [Lentzea xinjiangensis]SER40755.1 hypothetical protein SAMN05216188_11152 [Lentzea xinjiangensis]